MAITNPPNGPDLSGYIHNQRSFEHEYPPILRGGQVVAADHTIPLTYLDRMLYDGYNAVDKIWENLLWEANKDFFPILINQGPHTIEMRKVQWVNYHAVPEPMLHLMMEIRYLKTELREVVWSPDPFKEVAQPRYDLLPKEVPEDRKLVFFCAHCGVPYFWGDRLCTQCGSGLDYDKQTHKEF